MATTTTSTHLGPVVQPRRSMSAARRRDLRDGLLFTSPFLLGVLTLWIGPMLYSLYLVTQDWNIITPPEYVGLRNFQGQFATDWNLLMAAATMATIPVVALYLFTQRWFVRGITLSGFGGR